MQAPLVRVNLHSLFLLFMCDSGGILTLDLQNRNLTLYTAKLRSQCLSTKVQLSYERMKWNVENVCLSLCLCHRWKHRLAFICHQLPLVWKLYALVS